MARSDIPPLVSEAATLADRLDFPRDRATGGPSCCLPDTGRVLAMLAAGCTGGRIGEIGTGVGYGTAWMVHAMPADASLLTVELDEPRAVAAAQLFAHDPRVEVVHGDARAVIPDGGPFDLLFADGAGYGRDAAALASLVDLLRPGGRLVVDDVTPVAVLPEDSPFRQHDAKRDTFFRSGRLYGAEIVLPTLRDSVLVGTRGTA